MAFLARDVIVYLTEFPWKFLVPAHTGVVTRSTAITTFSKVTNYRSTFPGGFANVIPIGSATTQVAPPGTVTSPVASTDALTILGDDASEAAGITGHAPRPQMFTRYKLTFSVADEPSAGASPYSCWEDVFLALGGVDPLNELDE